MKEKMEGEEVRKGPEPALHIATKPSPPDNDY
jgi:hypothetical protein